MKVFVTGASGFIGSATVNELINAGHTVIGLARSEASAAKVKAAGAEALMGELTDLDILKKGAAEADGIIHTAFVHDFSKFLEATQIDAAAINAMGEVIMGTNKPFIVTAGILGLPKTNGFITEKDKAPAESPRISEKAAMVLAAKGVKVSIVRLPPSVHDKGDKGFIPFIIHQAIENKKVAFPNEGINRWPAVHRLDAATLFRLALEKGATGALYNAIGDEGIPLKDIATVIAKNTQLPLTPISGAEIAQFFQWMSMFIEFDSPSKADETKKQLGWQPTHIGLLEDMQQHYF